VPRVNWARVLSTSTEVVDGSMSGRRAIWTAGFQLSLQRPLLGVGAGSFRAAVEPYLRRGQTGSHNTAIGVLVEEGMVGLFLFAAILAACARTIFRSPAPHRTLWGIVLLAWLIGANGIELAQVKITWLLFGLISAQGGWTRKKRVLTTALSGQLAHAVHVSHSQRLPAGR